MYYVVPFTVLLFPVTGATIFNAMAEHAFFGNYNGSILTSVTTNTICFTDLIPVHMYMLFMQRLQMV